MCLCVCVCMSVWQSHISKCFPLGISTMALTNCSPTIITPLSRFRCWLARNAFYGACLAPIALILASNFVIFSLVIHQLRRLSARNDQRSMKHYDIQTQLRGAVAVVILLGLTWVFAIFAVGGASLVFQYLFCIFNSFQGLFIFIFYCVMKKDVKDIWRQKFSDFTTTVTSGDRSNGKSMFILNLVWYTKLIIYTSKRYLAI